MEWIREGVDFVVDLKIFMLLTYEDVAIRACGPPEVKVEDFKKITDYGNCNADHQVIKFFWEMFENFTQDERQKYLKFVWGRTKLPADNSELHNRHRIDLSDWMDPESFPEAHTCFFSVDVPNYKDLETMTKKFKTAIELCGEIDNDSYARRDDNEGSGGEGGEEEEDSDY